MPGLLELCDDLPEVRLAPGDVLVEDGSRTGSLWVLVSGSLSVQKAGRTVSRVSRPGAAVGEVALLRGAAHGATVVADGPAVLRRANDGAAFLDAHPEVLRALAVELAERLDSLTAYLADLTRQYGDAPGLSMVPAVLASLAGGDGPGAARPGSARDPDPEY